MIRHPIVQVETAEPAIGKVQVDLFTEPPLGPDTKTIAHKEHPDKQLGVD